MIPAWILLLLRQVFFPLRLSGGGSGSFPRPLRAEEERRCLELAARGDLEARNRLIEHNLRLVAHIVKKYYTPNGDQDDLISIGTIGLIKGISTFRPDKKVRLATYASRCIENEILMYFRAQRKTQGEVSLSDAIDGDGDGSALSQGRLPAGAPVRAGLPGSPGDPDHHPALRAQRLQAPDPAGGGGAVRHLPVLCIATQLM